ncbi:MAG: 2-phosphosulfolactate phosphatase [Deltaproteobacteria bacterium]|jgi:2-phosphosulfolactate phosphatase
MHVEIVRPRDLDGEADVAVVIDIFRATSTATTLLAEQTDTMAIAATPAEVLAHGEAVPRPLVFSEISQLDVPMDRVDNSPSVAKQLELAGRTPVLVTTNGTRTVDAVADRVNTILLGSFLSLSALVHHLRSLAPRRVFVVPAGSFSRNASHIEDDLCAEAIRTLLADGEHDPEEVVRAVRASERYDRRVRGNANFEADAEIALSHDIYTVVPVVRRESGLFWATPATT